MLLTRGRYNFFKMCIGLGDGGGGSVWNAARSLTRHVRHARGTATAATSGAKRLWEERHSSLQGRPSSLKEPLDLESGGADPEAPSSPANPVAPSSVGFSLLQPAGGSTAKMRVSVAAGSYDRRKSAVEERDAAETHERAAPPTSRRRPGTRDSSPPVTEVSREAKLSLQAKLAEVKEGNQRRAAEKGQRGGSASAPASRAATPPRGDVALATALLGASGPLLPAPLPPPDRRSSDRHSSLELERPSPSSLEQRRSSIEHRRSSIEQRRSSQGHPPRRSSSVPPTRPIAEDEADRAFVSV